MSDVYTFHLGLDCPPELEEFESTWNPLESCDPDAPDFLERIALVGDGCIIQTPNTETHWNSAAQHLLEGICILVKMSPLHSGERALVTVYDLLACGVSDEEYGSDGDRLSMEAVVQHMLHTARMIAGEYPEIAKALQASALGFWEKPENERGSVLSTLRVQCKFLSYPEIREILGHDNENRKKHLKSLRDVKRRDMSIYLCPAASKLALYSRFNRLFINFALQDFEAETTKPDIPPALICIDELPVIGYLRSIEVFSGYIRGFHGKFYLICQNLSQLQKTYPNAWETMLANNILHCYANSDMTTLEYMERRCAKTSVETTSTSSTTQAAIGNNTRTYQQFPLLTTSEAARLFSAIDPFKRQLVIWPGHDPIILQRVEYWNQQAPYFEKYFRAYWEFMNERV